MEGKNKLKGIDKVINHSRIPQLSLIRSIRWSGTPVTLRQVCDSLLHQVKNKWLSDMFSCVTALHGSKDALPCPCAGSLAGGSPSSCPRLSQHGPSFGREAWDTLWVHLQRDRWAQTSSEKKIIGKWKKLHSGVNFPFLSDAALLGGFVADAHSFL